ncbi:hypothetical protein Naga_101713g1 [Nannochloropsis gaditana]|uniref:Uncharacterized protein n=1 Tax=Nannochloropsis gaditana TaxID=72520 RepID=W7SZ34_9STRA|nr:hypothetical protein Naga_101713g1 [Nannochloropsis gaditana]
MRGNYFETLHARQWRCELYDAEEGEKASLFARKASLPKGWALARLARPPKSLHICIHRGHHCIFSPLLHMPSGMDLPRACDPKVCIPPPSGLLPFSAVRLDCISGETPSSTTSFIYHTLSQLPSSPSLHPPSPPPPPPPPEASDHATSSSCSPPRSLPPPPPPPLPPRPRARVPPPPPQAPRPFQPRPSASPTRIPPRRADPSLWAQLARRGGGDGVGLHGAGVGGGGDGGVGVLQAGPGRLQPDQGQAIDGELR